MSVYLAFLGFILGFGLVYITIPPLIRVSIAKHLYDKPNERKATKFIVPTLGGVAIFIGFILSTIFATGTYAFSEFKYLTAAVIIMFFIGLKDDLMDISARKKLLVQIATAAMLIVIGNFRFTNLQGAFGLHEISYPISFAITLFAMIALINAFNLIDGIDGLASGLGILISSVFGTWFLMAGHQEYGIMCFSLTGSLLAFFIYNVFGKKNKIFMGDTGSLILGTIIVVLVIKFNEFNINQQTTYAVLNAPVVSLGILIIPVIDTLRVFLIRISERRSPFSPDMNHIHHQFLKLGNSHRRSTAYMVLINILFIGFTYSLNRILNINNLMISIIALGFILAYVPCLFLQRKEAAYSMAQRNVEVKAEPNLRKLIKIAESASLHSAPNEPLVIRKKVAEKEELVESDY